MFKYTKAVCRKVPKSIVAEGLRTETEEEPMSYELAVQQHEEYMKTLKQLGLEVILLDSDESLPDCVFVEDAAVVINDTVLITNPGAKSRKGEFLPILDFFKKQENRKVIQMSGQATLDGGDVLFTGSEIFVGMSKRTNLAGAAKLREAFSPYPVHIVAMAGFKTLHLKSLMSMISPKQLVCGMSVEAENALGQVLSKSNEKYEVVRLPDDHAANCLSINGTVVFSVMDKESRYVVESLEKKIFLDSSELAKVDGALTCCSLLYN